MKKNKITKHFIRLISYIIEYGIAFSIADIVTNAWGVSHTKILSSGFALYIIIVTIIIFILEFLFLKTTNIWSKRRGANK
ncbi:MAG: hypothetical protein H7Y18_07665 [Clostridiaceae bacterium]|nr:hypothetical protein [Clostridiaceae bacterium]